MGAYADYVMNDADGEAAAGICHARGGNAELPPQWLVYITVDDLDHSMAECERLGGSVLDAAAQLRRRPLLRDQGSRRRRLRPVPAARTRRRAAAQADTRLSISLRQLLMTATLRSSSSISTARSIDSRRDLADAANALIVERGGTPLAGRRHRGDGRRGSGAAGPARAERPRGLDARRSRRGARAISRALRRAPARAHAPLRRHARGTARRCGARAARGAHEQAAAPDRTDPRRTRHRAFFTLGRSAATRRTAASRIRRGLQYLMRARPARRRRETVMVGDSAIDLRTARAAGTRVLPGPLRVRLPDARRSERDRAATDSRTELTRHAR